MTIDQVTTDPRHLRLSEQQKKFVYEICTNGNDKVKAAHAAWDCKNDSSAQTMANRALKKPEIKSITSDYFGKTILDELLTKDELLALAAQKARTCEKDADTYKFLTLIAQLNGWMQKAAEPDPDETDREPSRLDLIKQLEKQ